VATRSTAIGLLEGRHLWKVAECSKGSFELTQFSVALSTIAWRRTAELQASLAVGGREEWGWILGAVGASQAWCRGAGAPLQAALEVMKPLGAAALMSVLAWVVRGPGGGAGPGNSALRGLLQTCGAGRGRDHLIMMTSCSAGRSGQCPGAGAVWRCQALCCRPAW
jgi:hypothetical protein